MDEFCFWFFLFLIFVGIPIGFLWLLYFIGKKLESRRTGIILSFSVGLMFLLGGLYLYFEDEFFTEFQARKILKNNKVYLKDNFEILSNETSGGFGDYYQEFHLKITKKDKERLLNIFKKKSDSLKLLKSNNPDYYENTSFILKENKGMDESDVEIISISKTKNELEYQIFND